VAATLVATSPAQPSINPTGSTIQSLVYTSQGGGGFEFEDSMMRHFVIWHDQGSRYFCMVQSAWH
jgi:hypothetical protein